VSGVHHDDRPVEDVVADVRSRGAEPYVVGPVDDKPGLIAALRVALDFPDWVGANWDALSDALRDLSWLPGGPVTVIWIDPGRLRPERDERLARQVLRDAAHGRLTVVLVGAD
jgi:hypothetical protein